MLNQRQKLLIKLLSTGHLNVLERRLLGEAPTFSELLEVALYYFREATFLPGIVTKWDDNTLCYEGYCLEKKDELYVLHFQAAGAFLNLQANQKEEYLDLRKALYVFLQREFHFNIDGIPVVEV